jgi:hypothetical protein
VFVPVFSVTRTPGVTVMLVHANHAVVTIIAATRTPGATIMLVYAGLVHDDVLSWLTGRPPARRPGRRPRRLRAQRPGRHAGLHPDHAHPVGTAPSNATVLDHDRIRGRQQRGRADERAHAGARHVGPPDDPHDARHVGRGPPATCRSRR